MELTVITRKIVDGKPSLTDFNVTRYRDNDLIGAENEENGQKGAKVDTKVAEKLFQFAETNKTSTEFTITVRNLEKTTNSTFEIIFRANS